MVQHIREAVESFFYKFWLWIFNINIASVAAWLGEYSPAVLAVLTGVTALLAAMTKYKREKIELQLKQMDMDERRQVNESHG